MTSERLDVFTCSNFLLSNALALLMLITHLAKLGVLSNLRGKLITNFSPVNGKVFKAAAVYVMNESNLFPEHGIHDSKNRFLQFHYHHLLFL